MANDRVQLTQEGQIKLKDELEHLRSIRRPEMAAALELARETNLSTEDEPGYELAREEQSAVEGRIAVIEDMLVRAQIIDERAAQQSGVAQLGSTVMVRGDDGREQTYHIVGPMEVDVIHGKISDESPVGRALMGRRAGDSVAVSVPNGTRTITVVSLT